MFNIKLTMPAPKFILSLLLLLPLTYQAMDFTTLINGTYNETCPPCDCTDQTSSLIALGTIAGSFSFCYVVKKCLERRKTPAQKQREQINKRERIIRTLEQERSTAELLYNQRIETAEQELHQARVQKADPQLTDRLLEDPVGSVDFDSI